jgi:hypothetical protein
MKNPLRTRLTATIRADLPDGQFGDVTSVPDWADNRIKDPMGRDFLRFLIKKEASVLALTGSTEIVITSSVLAEEVGISKAKLRELILCFIELNIITYLAPEGSKKMSIKLNDIKVWFLKGMGV